MTEPLSLGPLGVELLAPYGLLLGLLLVPLVILYILRIERRRVRVASTLWFAAAHRDLLARRPFRKLVPQIPLLLQATAVLLLAVAFARPSCVAGQLGGENVAIVIDTSASMTARTGPDGAATTRMELAKQRAREVVEGLAPGSAALILAAGAEAHLVVPLERDRSRLRRGIDALEAEDAEGSLTTALALAADRLGSTGPDARIFVLTDGQLAHDPAWPRHIAVSVETVGSPIENTAIIKTDVRSGVDPGSGRERVEAFVLLRSWGEKSREAYVTMREENASDVLASRRIVLSPNETVPVVLGFDVTPGDYGRGLIFEVSPGDALPVDDLAYGRVPEGRRIPVTILSAKSSPSPWIRRVFASDPGVSLTVGPWSTAALDAIDPEGLLVIEGACPEGPVARDVLVVAPNEGPCLGVTVRKNTEKPAITAWDSSDPRLRFLTLDGLHVAQTNVIETQGPGRDLVRSDLGTIVADVSTPTQTGTLLAFEVGDSDWPLSASFVLFSRNIVELARSHRGGSAGSARAGEPLLFRPSRGATEANVEGPGGFQRTIAVQGDLAILPNVSRAGLYRASFNGPRPTTTLGAVSLASALESDVSRVLRPEDVPQGIEVGDAKDAPEGHREGAFVLALAALLFVLADLTYLTWGAKKRPLRPLLWALIALSLGPLALVALELLGLPSTSLVRFARPSATLLLAGAGIFAALRLTRWGHTQGRARVVLKDLVTSLLVFCLGLAVAGAEVGRPLDHMAVIVAIDRSRSIDLVPNAELRVSEELRVAELAMREGDTLATLAFGAEATLEEPARKRGQPRVLQQASVGRDGTDLGAAIRRALAEVPPDSAARVVLLSDGVATTGDAFEAATAALATDIPVDTLLLEQRKMADLRLVDLRVAPEVGEGQDLDLRIVVASPKATEVEVRVRRDGELITRATTRVAEGEDVLRIHEVAESAGVHRYDVEVSALDPSLDESADDNAKGAIVRVTGPSTALVVDGDGATSFIAKTLVNAGFRVSQGDIAALPMTLPGLASYDLVVFGDVRAGDLTTDQIEALASYARDLGGGLLLMGGDRSFGPGGYAKTALEEVSPVSFDLKQDRRRTSLAEVIAIDISGSMAAAVGGRTKLELANEGAARSASLLGPGDRLGVAHVDTAVRWSVPLAPIADAAAIERAIREVGPGGGGIFVDVSLEAAYAALVPERVNLKHVLLFADGSDAEQMDGCRLRVEGALRQGITTSVVALGAGSDVPELEALSRLGNGRFYLVEDAARLPAIFTEETVLATRSALHEEPFRASSGMPGPATTGVDLSSAPALGGYVVTLPKGRSAVLLGATDGDPLLASWSVGLGHAAAFTSDLKGRWGSAWTHWPGAARLVAQLARDLARRPDDERVRVDVAANGGALRVGASVVGDDGRSQSFRQLDAHVTGPGGFQKVVPLDPVGAGAYGASLPLLRTGPYLVVTRDRVSGEVLGTSGAVLGSGDEVRPTGSDRAALAQVSKVSRGRVRDNLANVFEDRVTPRVAHDDITRALLFCAAFALLLAVSARRLAVPEVVTRWLASFGRAPKVKLTEGPSAALAATLLEAKRAQAKSPAAPLAPPQIPAKKASITWQPHKPPESPQQPPSLTPPPSDPSSPPGPAPSAIELLAAKRRNRR